MWNGGNVCDKRYVQSHGFEPPKRSVAAGARAFNIDLYFAKSLRLGFAGYCLHRRGCRIRGAFACTLKPCHTGRTPAEGIAGRIGDRDDRVVEGSGDEHFAFFYGSLRFLSSHPTLSLRANGVSAAISRDCFVASAPRNDKQKNLSFLFFRCRLLSYFCPVIFFHSPDRDSLAALGAGVRPGPLAPDGELFPMAIPAVTADITKPFDII